MLSSSRLMSGCTTTPTISSASRVSNTHLYHECFNCRGRGVRTVISVRYVTGRLDLHQSSCYSSITSQRLIIIIPSAERSTDRLAFIASNWHSSSPFCRVIQVFGVVSKISSTLDYFKSSRSLNWYNFLSRWPTYTSLFLFFCSWWLILVWNKS